MGEFRLPPTVLNEETEMAFVQTLKPFPGNARQGNVDALAAIIRENGFVGFLVVNKRPGKYERTILAGNHRWEAAQRVGLGSVPVVWVDVDDDRAEKINAADNRASDLAGYDEAQRLVQLRDMVDRVDPDDAEMMLRGIGYTSAAVEEIRKAVEDPPKPNRPPRKTRILVQCRCGRCGEEWTGYIDEDANIQRVNQRGREE